MSDPVIAVHGGAGGRVRVALSDEQRAEVRRSLAESLTAGRDVLVGGGTAVDAVVAAVIVLEDCPVLNAGRGSVLRSNGEVQLDASVMDGRDRGVGAVAAVRGLRNPVCAARDVLYHSRHVLLVADGAEAFARERGLATEPPEYFVTEARRRQLESARQAHEPRLDHDSAVGGTVGAVALDAEGHLASATSTGGMTNAAPSRVGDTPVVGAGFWADDATCAVSATGGGEFFVRAAFSHEVDAGLRLAGLPLDEACARALERVRELEGNGGCVAVDARGAISLPCTTVVMPRGFARADSRPRVAVARDDELELV